MKTKFNITTNTVDIFTVDNDQLLDKLPNKVYSVSYNKYKGYYLTLEQDNFTLPSKIYGNTITKANKIFHTYQARETNTGIILTGDKGSGKSLLSKILANTFINNNLPVILINNPYYGDNFFNFINSIGNCILIFDEFAKVYVNEDNRSLQDKLLSFFDGMYSSNSKNHKRLVLIIENDNLDLNKYLKERPGRFLYNITYGKLNSNEIEDYCNDYKVTKEFINEIKEFSYTSEIFSFDILQAIIEEHLRFPDLTFIELINDLNINIEKNEYEYTVLKVYDPSKKPIKINENCTFRNSGDIRFQEIFKDIEDYKEFSSYSLYISNIVYEQNNTMIIDQDNFTFVLKKTKINNTNYKDLII